ncbi:MAG: thioredoxin [Lachnospiraceae bacterium]|nr:thioredoxin [Lachnospiraceae bacterium]MBQ5561543.1 thioredoxin [Lachnospiraceae bacterium]
MEYQFTTNNFETEVTNSDIPVMIDFYADWCGPCKMMSPIVNQMADKYDGKVKIGKVNVDQNPELAGRFGIMSIPSFLFIKDGKVVNSSVGGMSPDMLSSKIDTLLQA